ncbi:hypothetical protein ACKXF4_16515 [Faecalibacterium prausnitzii]|uniref:hypothetical protein n=1 Tax=Faecalibacterium prausnitzii TaxID=853 RepID=UPI003AAEBF82
MNKIHAVKCIHLCRTCYDGYPISWEGSDGKKVFFYTRRPDDELGIAQRLAPQLDVEFGSTQEYPTLENAELAKGYDAVSVTPCDMSAPMVKRFHELGVA